MISVASRLLIKEHLDKVVWKVLDRKQKHIYHMHRAALKTHTHRFILQMAYVLLSRIPSFPWSPPCISTSGSHPSIYDHHLYCLKRTHTDLTYYRLTCGKALPFFSSPPPIWLNPWRPAERRKWGDPQVTPRRLRGPGSLHVSISRHNDKTVPYRYLRKRGRQRMCMCVWGAGGSVGARKVEQIRNGGFCRDIWNGITQQPPKAISVSVQDKICQSAACYSSTPPGLTLILKPVCSTVAALNWV